MSFSSSTASEGASAAGCAASASSDWKTTSLSADFPDHHQIITTMQGALGETRSIFISLSPRWDSSRAPEGYRAATVTTHTDVQQWWDMPGEAAYEAKKAEYIEAMLTNIECVIPGFRAGIALTMPGTPITYQFYTGRHRGMVGGFPQTSLFKARSPLTGIVNVRIVGDSIFPGQSTAGVTLGAIRVATDVHNRIASLNSTVFTTGLSRSMARFSRPGKSHNATDS